MSVLSEKIVEIKGKYAVKHLIAEDASDALEKQLERLIPELREIDQKLSGTGMRLLAVAMKKSVETFDEVQADVTALRARKEALLVANGYPADYLDPHYECEKCRDSGYVGDKMCSCLRRELIQASFECAGIGRLVEKCNFDTFDLSYYREGGADYESMCRNFEIMKDYARNFNPETSPNLILFGGTGLGKTHLSLSVAKEVIEAGWDTVYTGAIGMISDFEAVRFRNTDDATASGNQTSRYFECQLLIIDDLGTEVVNQFTNGCIYDVINRRINSGLPTVISCNLSQREIASRYTDRIASRIFGEYMPLLFTGTDVRQQKIRRGNV